MVIARDAIPAVVLPREEVSCEALGGDVVVRGMDLPESMRFYAARRRLVVPQGDESEDEAVQRAGITLIPMVLSWCVLAADDKPVYSESEWSAWAGRHLVEAFELFTVASRLSGTDAADQKKD